MKTELIERYLTRQMTDEERTAFEQEMREQPQLAEDVKIVAWTIEAIRERGQQEDAERIMRMREDMGSDSKRYATTVAAVIGGVLLEMNGQRYDNTVRHRLEEIHRAMTGEP